MRKRWLKYLLALIAIVVVAVFATDYWVSRTVKKQVYDDVRTIKHNKVGLVLGTSKYIAKGVKNLYYKYRIEAAVELYRAGKIDFILVSGDNRKMNYNEPQTMKKDLVAAGIPAHRIFLDYAGFRTLDSIVRCKAIFGQTNVTIISQLFHNERALYIANRRGLKAIAYNAQDPPADLTIKVMIREKLARIKMMLDLLINKQPKFFGDPIEVKEEIIQEITHPDIEHLSDVLYVGAARQVQLTEDTLMSENDCRHWWLTKKNVLALTQKLKPVSGNAWHKQYKICGCEIPGRLLVDSVEYKFEINAGGYMKLYNDTISYLYGCPVDSCKDYFPQRMK